MTHGSRHRHCAIHPATDKQETHTHASKEITSYLPELEPHFEFDNSSDVLKEVKHQLNKKDVIFIKLVNDQYNTNIVKLLVYTKAVL